MKNRINTEPGAQDITRESLLSLSCRQNDGVDREDLTCMMLVKLEFVM